jgi:hypothetical protein
MGSEFWWGKLLEERDIEKRQGWLKPEDNLGWESSDEVS